MNSNILKNQNCRKSGGPVDHNYGVNPVSGYDVAFSPLKSTSVFEQNENWCAHQEAAGATLAHIAQKLR